MRSDVARRRRAVTALGLGPLWIARSSLGDGASGDAAESRAAAIATMDREALTAAVAGCRACPLGETRLRAVFGDGPENAALMLIGRAPNAADEATGAAVAGDAGRLLDAMLIAIGVARETDAFVTQRVKCRPPGDRPPTAQEIATCRPFVDRQTALIAPRLVVALGSPGTGETLAIPDPESLLAHPEKKAEAWTALCEVRRLWLSTAPSVQ